MYSTKDKNVENMEQRVTGIALEIVETEHQLVPDTVRRPFFCPEHYPRSVFCPRGGDLDNFFLDEMNNQTQHNWDVRHCGATLR